MKRCANIFIKTLQMNKKEKRREFSERIKKFHKVRDYMREFYVYGFKTRESFADRKSLRSYDNEKRRIESYLSDFMSFRQNERGKTIYITADSTDIFANPFYRAFKAKTFTKKDITLHFLLMDILNEECPLSIPQLIEIIDKDYLSQFEKPMEIDSSTVRNKVKEYEQLGILVCEKQGKTLLYRKTKDCIDLKELEDAITFFSEASPLGVVGSFILDRQELSIRGCSKEAQEPIFSFKHNYIMHALESEIFCEAVDAIHKQQKAEIIFYRNSARNKGRSKVKNHQGQKPKEIKEQIVPLKIIISLQNGRRYLSAYNLRDRHIFNYRLDSIDSIIPLGPYHQVSSLLEEFERLADSSWGVSFGSGKKTEQVEVALWIEDKDSHIIQRIQREGRHGTLSKVQENTYLYSIEVQDAKEMMPWLKTFIGRILFINFSNKNLEKIFMRDIRQMMRNYEVVSHDI